MQYVIGFVNCFVKKHYFHGICTFSKKPVNFTRSCAFAQKSLILRVINVKKT